MYIIYLSISTYLSIYMHTYIHVCVCVCVCVYVCMNVQYKFVFVRGTSVSRGFARCRCL